MLLLVPLHLPNKRSINSINEGDVYMRQPSRPPSANIDIPLLFYESKCTLPSINNSVTPQILAEAIAMIQHWQSRLSAEQLPESLHTIYGMSARQMQIEVVKKRFTREYLKWVVDGRPDVAGYPEGLQLSAMVGDVWDLAKTEGREAAAKDVWSVLEDVAKAAEDVVKTEESKDRRHAVV